MMLSSSQRVVVIYAVLNAVSIWTLVSGGQADHSRIERSVSGRDQQSVNAELATDLQWLRDKTAQVIIVETV